MQYIAFSIVNLLIALLTNGVMFSTSALVDIDSANLAPPVDDDHLYNVVDVLQEIAEETGKSIPQVAINWLLQKDTVANIVIGARNEQQLIENLEATGWALALGQIQRLDEVSKQVPLYPHWVGER